MHILLSLPKCSLLPKFGMSNLCGSSSCLFFHSVGSLITHWGILYAIFLDVIFVRLVYCKYWVLMKQEVRFKFTFLIGIKILFVLNCSVVHRHWTQATTDCMCHELSTNTWEFFDQCGLQVGNFAETFLVLQV